MLLACVMLFSVLVAPEVEAKEETVTQIAEMRAMGQFDFELPPKTLMKANSSFPMERGETVKITASYSPESASVDFGLIDSDGIFYPIDAHMVTWGITSNAGGAMVFTGTVSTNRGQIFVLGDIEFDGDCGGTIDNVTTLKGKNTATLSGFMIDSRGISITAPDVSSNYYR